MISKFFDRRNAMKTIGAALAGLVAMAWAKPLAAATTVAGGGDAAPAAPQRKRAPNGAMLSPEGYDPMAHHWQMVVDIEKCIGCGLCAKACKRENNVPKEPFYFRTWIERYIIKKAKSGTSEARGETVVDSPNGGIDGFPLSSVPAGEMLKSFFVPKLCNQCVASPCTQACPVGATFDAPDGAVLIDTTYCIGCAFCIQACPYGCRYLHPTKKTADKCSLCYHRITRGLRPACVEVCPNGARIFADLMDESPDNPVRRFLEQKKVNVLKPHLGTHPKVLYAGMDKEVR